MTRHDIACIDDKLAVPCYQSIIYGIVIGCDQSRIVGGEAVWVERHRVPTSQMGGARRRYLAHMGIVKIHHGISRFQ